MSDLSPDQDFWRALDALLREEATAEELAQLETRLRVDPQACRDYLAYCRLHAVLELELAAQAEGQTARQAIMRDAPPPPSRPTGPRRDPRDARPRATWWRRAAWRMARPHAFSCILAAVILFNLITFFAMIPRENSTATQPNLSATPRPTMVARLTGYSGAQWADPSTAPAWGHHLAAGQQLDLVRGLVELKFDSGAVVLLEGPAQFLLNPGPRPHPAGTGRLMLGRLTARIEEPSAAGFSIETPTARVVDYGTEFGVEVAADGTCEVAVFQGSVEVESRASAESPAPWRLMAGQTARSPANQAERWDIADLATDAARFRRNMPQPLVSGVTTNDLPADVLPGGMLAFTEASLDRNHHFLARDGGQIPASILGGDLVRLSVDARENRDLQVRIKLSRPAQLYVLWPDFVRPTAWLTKDYERTTDQLILDVWPDQSNHKQEVFTVWKRNQPAEGEVLTGPIKTSMYNVVATEPPKRASKPAKSPNQKKTAPRRKPNPSPSRR